MQVFSTVNEVHIFVKKQKEAGKTIGFVPTMGALHQGHISLVKKSVNENDICIASIFVNPTQFNNKKDLEKYPRTLEKDLEMLQNAGCNIVFSPNEREMYPNEEKASFDLGFLDEVMEGKHRPGHFQGVAQIVSKLFEAIPADKAYFGKKDFQQLAVINRLVFLKNFKIQIVACPIVREENGLAMSSRNELLSKEIRQKAGLIHTHLQKAKQLFGNINVKSIEKQIIENIHTDKNFQVEYFEIVDSHSLKPAGNETKKVTACIAVVADNVRLIDNLEIK